MKFKFGDKVKIANPDGFYRNVVFIVIDVSLFPAQEPQYELRSDGAQCPLQFITESELEEVNEKKLFPSRHF